MDPQTTLTHGQTISFQANLMTGNYCNTAALALLVYDYILLLGKEIDLFWKCKITRASLLFLVNRYLPIIAYIMRPAKMLPMSCFSNSIMQLVSQTLSFSQYLPWAVFSALRAFALCKRPYNWPTAALVFTLSCVSIVANFVMFYWITPVQTMFQRRQCILYEVQVPLDIEAYLSLGARACLIVADTIVVCVTWQAISYKLPWTTRNSTYGIVNKKDTFSNILLRDGIVYFVVLAIMNVVYLTLTMFHTQISQSSHVSFVVQLYEPLVAVLTSRFLLDLHEANHQSGTSQSAFAPSPTPPERSVVFARRAVSIRYSLDSRFSPLWDETSTNRETGQPEEEEDQV